MIREIIVDTETTGLDAKEGHRIIELSAVVLDHTRVGRIWHSHFDPGRPIEAGATKVHGITDDMVRGGPRFVDKASDFLTFVSGAYLIAHNAPFDDGFIQAELARCKRKPTWLKFIDTLAMARKKVPGQKHTLDALCKHYGVSLAGREKHSATLDCKLLAEVYVRLEGRLDQLAFEMPAERIWFPGGECITLSTNEVPHPGPRPVPLPSRLTELEAAAHRQLMEQIKGEKHHGD